MKTKSRVTHRAMHHLVLAVCISFLAPTVLSANGVSTFTPTGSMVAGRGEHTTTVLQNGKILVAGGFDSASASLASTELYDPATGTWSATGSMNIARYEHTATLLPNGKVLVAGGLVLGSTVAAAEIYDPATGIWTTTAPMSVARRIHTATLLPNGKVLVAGGYTGATDLSSAELYDPATGTWSPTGSLVTKRYLATATLLPNGKVLVASGYSEAAGFASNATCELYDPATGAWTATGSLTTSRYYHSALLLPNGTVLAAGGYNSFTGYQASAEIYDPVAGTWSPTGSLIDRRYYFGMTLLPNGKVMAVAGYNDLSFFISGVETYDPGTGIWSAAGSTTNARGGFSAVMMPNGKVLAAGGATNGGVLAGAEVFDPAAGSFGPSGPLGIARSEHTATLLPNGKVLAVGGIDGGGYLGSAELFEMGPGVGTWSSAGTLANARIHHTTTLLPNGKVLVAGGYNGAAMTSAELYNPATGAWSVTGSLANARYEHTATLLPNGKVLVVGGYAGAPLGSAELYDPATGTWSAAGVPLNVRYVHNATLLPNGNVLVSGGYGVASYLDTAEIYNTSAGTWSAANPMNGLRGYHSSTLLPNGKVLVAAGANNGGYLNSAELFDPAAGTWTPTGSMATARVFFPAVLLTNGSVLVAGGRDASPAGFSSAELYDPASGTWKNAGTLATARHTFAAALVPNGMIVMTGGNAGGYLSSTELYDVGFGFGSLLRPVITGTNSPLGVDGNLILTGVRFRGKSGASSGNYMDGSTNYPVVQFRSLENEQTTFLLPSPSSGWSDTSFTSVPTSGFSPGFFLATVFTNGIPSSSAIVRIAKPEAVSGSLGDVVTGGSAPDATGADSGTKFDVLKRGGYLGENGALVFPGQLLIGSGTPPVTVSPNTFMGLWKDDGSGLKLLARSGNDAPETGATAAKFDVLPQTPAINDSGEVTFLASLAINGSSTPPTTVDNDTGLWSELGGTGLGILIREGDVIPPLAPLQVGAFASGAFATAHTGAATGEAAFAVTLKNGSTDTAILRASITGPTVTAVGVVARENTAMPGVAGELFGNLAGSYSDSIRMDATGNLCFVALSKTTNRESIWFQAASPGGGGGAVTKAFIAGTAATGDIAPGTGNATFKNIKSPSIGSGGIISFRGFLNTNGDNTGGKKGDGIWRGTTSGGFSCILRSGDDNTARPGLGLPAGALVGNLWHSWLTNANHGAWKGWLDVNGNGTSYAADGDVNAIYTDLSGTMVLALKVGDAAPGIAGAIFVSFGLPVVGGVEQYATLGNVTGGGTTAANNWGIWRSGPNGGPLSLVLRTGDTMTTTQGVKTIAKVDLPDSGATDRRWEQPIMDATGRLLVNVTFVGGATTHVLVP